LKTVKEKLYAACIAYVTQRIDTAQRAIEIAQASANEETKSSAGDKYETGRAMMQLEIEKNTVQLNEAMKLKQALDQIVPSKPVSTIQPGSLVITDGHTYYIAISAGQITIEGKSYFAISSGSPIGLLLKGLQEGDTFVFNKKTVSILSVK